MTHEFIEDWRPIWEWIDENLNHEIVKKIDAALAETQGLAQPVEPRVVSPDDLGSPMPLICPHCGVWLLDDGISLRCPTDGPIEMSPRCF